MEASKRQIIAGAFISIVEKIRNGCPQVKLGLMAKGSELGQEEILMGARVAQRENPQIKVVAIGPRLQGYEDMEWIETPDCEGDIAAAVDKALADGSVAGAVAIHFPFPVGVTTIGRVLTPAKGKPMYIASCTGVSASACNEALLRNSIYGIATAKACGIEKPLIAFLNIDGAGPVLRALTSMKEKGYSVRFGASARGDGGSLLRGNDVLAGVVDVLVCDTLTGNVLVKMFSAFTTGGLYESTGWGYGPSVGENWNKVISIVSRASGASVIAGALALTAQAVSGKLPDIVSNELKKARLYGFDDAVAALKFKKGSKDVLVKPAPVPVNAEIAGVDVLDMESAEQTLWKEGIYAESAMGCTGPVLRVQSEKREQASAILRRLNFI